MSFKKYFRIENGYRSSYIERALNNDPSIETVNYVLQEKIHGANISFLFDVETGFSVYSRNNKLDPQSNEFYGLADVLGTPEISTLIKTIQDFSNNNTVTIRLYGELFGSNIQKGVWYGDRAQILFYDVEFDGELQPVHALVSLMMSFDQVKDWFVPHVTVTESFTDAMEFDVSQLKSMLTPDGYDKPNIMEGVVIKPYFEKKVDQFDKAFYIKNKNEAFLEKAKEKKPREVRDDNVEILRSQFISYLTDMRLQGIFSKYGMIKDITQMGEYIRYIHFDALEDFMGDFGDEFGALAKGDQKYITGSSGRILSSMIKVAL
jgi:Rnl2 family RNA ligase